jgi:hypothetical protein
MEMVCSEGEKSTRKTCGDTATPSAMVVGGSEKNIQDDN